MTEVVTISPTTNEPVLRRPAITLEEIKQLPSRAQTAFGQFKKTKLEQRQAIIRKALDLLAAREDALSKDLAEHMGRPIKFGPAEIKTAVKRGDYLLKVSSEVLADTPGEPEDGFQRYIAKVPVGVVLIIFPWNYPWLCLMNSLIPAILAGNAVILKPSPQTPTVAEHIHDIFKQSGLPDGVIQYFHSETVAHIEEVVASPLVDLVCFTGSVATGRAVSRTAGNRFINVGLELGGKDPAYVRADADPAWAAAELVDGAIFNSGQSCCSIERIYAHSNIYDKFVEECKHEIEKTVVGDPRNRETGLGPVVSKRAKETIEKHVADAVAKGAKDQTPHIKSFESLSPQGGNWVKPTLLTEVDHTMLVMTEETFGPVVAVMKVTNDDEAIRLMNDSEFGLTASVWTKDVSKGHELIDDLEAGTVFVNRCDYPSPDLAWTGWKNSGRGATLSKHGFDNFIKLKSYHIKAYPAGK